jgi:hypothetical protein
MPALIILRICQKPSSKVCNDDRVKGYFKSPNMDMGGQIYPQLFLRVIVIS